MTTTERLIADARAAREKDNAEGGTKDKARGQAGQVIETENEKRQTDNSTSAKIGNCLPIPMKSARRWLLWKSIPQVGKKPKKVPYYASGIKRSTTDTPEDAAQLCSYDEARQALASGRYTGLGFALGADGTGNHWQGVDLDDLPNRPELEGLLPLLPGHTERSPSGNGYHALGYGRHFPTLGSNESGIEAYAGGRYFTVTENSGAGDLCDLADYVASILAPMHKRKPAATSDEVEPDLFITDETYRDLRSALTALRSDSRELWVNVGQALKAGGDRGRAIWLEWSQTSDKYDAGDADRVWDSFTADRTGYAAIFAKAQRAGWLNPKAKPNALPVPVDLPVVGITMDELNTARLSPRVILKDLLYADVRTRISAGGTGKTTLALHEAVMLALGRDLWGREPARQCRTVIVTREDNREILVARLREIINAQMLDDNETHTVLANVLVVDLSGVCFRLSTIVDDLVVPHTLNLQGIIDKLRNWGPDWIIFDPLVSFGVGESRVNDAEQGLIEAFRVLRNCLDCCVEGIHHSGKANSREKALDQYAGRGGSALSDGSRMVVVMQPLEAQEWQRATGSYLADGEDGIVMALPKLSYAKKQDPIYIKRRGYRFDMVAVCRRSPEESARQAAQHVLEFITSEYAMGRKYSREDTNDIEKQIARILIEAGCRKLAAEVAHD